MYEMTYETKQGNEFYIMWEHCKPLYELSSLNSSSQRSINLSNDSQINTRKLYWAINETVFMYVRVFSYVLNAFRIHKTSGSQLYSWNEQRSAW